MEPPDTGLRLRINDHGTTLGKLGILVRLEFLDPLEGCFSGTRITLLMGKPYHLCIYIYMYLPMRVISTYAGGLVVISSLPAALVIGLQFPFHFSCSSVSWFVIHPYPIHPQKTHLFLAQNNPKPETLWPFWKTISLYFSHRHTGSLKRFPKGPL